MMSDDVREAWPKRIAILGIGLLGGSVALAVRRASADVRVVGWSRSESTCREALELGVIDEIAESCAAACRDCDVVVVAAPVDRIVELASVAIDASPATCLVTDVGSTKAAIVEQLRSHAGASQKFVAAHPIAGREKTGVRFALATLFNGKTVVLTPDHWGDGATARAAIERATAFWRLTGGNVISMRADEHDATLAATSHVPHLVSALVAKLLPPDARQIVGSGWMDITRVAAGDPEMWAAICRENREAIRGELQRFADSVRKLQQMIDDGDDAGLLTWLAAAKTIRDQIQ